MKEFSFYKISYLYIINRMSNKYLSKRKLKKRGKTGKNKKTRKNKFPKYFKRNGGMPGKKVTFGEVEEREFVTPMTKLTREDVELASYNLCPPIKHIRPYHFPCKYKNTVFSDKDEFAEWYRSEIERQYKPGVIPKSKYKDYIKNKELSESGYWDTYIPEEFRSYDETTGVVEDIRPFAIEDEEISKGLLREKRRERKQKNKNWQRDVKEFREDTDFFNS
jgi:hypothetical protein